jgi:hypothetical protein
MSKQSKYEFEDIRSFFMKRKFLTEYRSPPLDEAEFQSLKDRTLGLSADRASYLRAFIDGWTYAKS